jgi:PAS domain-containing protein
MHSTKLRVELLADNRRLAERLAPVFGSPHDGVEQVAERAARLLPDLDAIVWQGDPQTFQFNFVSEQAERVLGYPVARWKEDGFWARTIVHPDDQDDAIAYCALATGQCLDHDFQYRARASDGRIVVLHDVVHVITGARGVATALRGIMLPVPQEGRLRGN